MVIVIVSLAALGVLAVGALVFAVIVYNSLVRLRNDIERNWSNIDVLLKQRFDEVPRLVEVCKGYMKHERETLEAVTAARNAAGRAGDERAVMGAQNEVSGALRHLFAVAENYPDLKADEMFRSLSRRISDLEDQIADRREFFNESVNIYNTTVEQFPDLMVARPMGFASRLLWRVDAGERAAPRADLRNL